MKLKEVSRQLRAALWAVVYSSLVSESVQEVLLGRHWEKILYRRHVLVEHLMADDFSQELRVHVKKLKHLFVNGSYVEIFDFIEMLLRDIDTPFGVSNAVERALKECQAAYTIVDGTSICPIASEQEAETIKSALSDLSKYEYRGAKKHLKQAIAYFNEERLADSVRESIHSVESIAKILNPDASTLGPALKALTKSQAIHPALQKGFGEIYGYTSNEKGIRHALIDKGVADVDMHDALFMIGACAAFVSYLIGKGRAAGLVKAD